MVEILHWGASWTRDEESHLATCADCRAEWGLLQATARLGSQLAPPDVQGLAGAVRERLREAPAVVVLPLRARRRWERWTLGLVAAATILFAVGLGVSRWGVRDEVTQGVVLGELEDLSTSELETVLGDLDQPSDVVMPAGPVGLSDLTVDELEQILASWEG
jgi:predicted anti-sigma-YlaC factor YlaD